MRVNLSTYNEDGTIALGERLSALLYGGTVVLLDGDLGAGKTRFAKGVARGLGVTADIISPTFNLVLEYPLSAQCTRQAPGPTQAQVLRHFDLYRLEDAAELEDIDYFGLIEDNEAVSLVEWGSRFESALPQDYLSVRIETLGASLEQRRFEIRAAGESSEMILARFAAQEGLIAHG